MHNMRCLVDIQPTHLRHSETRLAKAVKNPGAGTRTTLTHKCSRAASRPLSPATSYLAERNARPVREFVCHELEAQAPSSFGRWSSRSGSGLEGLGFGVQGILFGGLVRRILLFGVLEWGTQIFETTIC